MNSHHYSQHTHFFYKEPLNKEPACRRPKMELVLLRTKSQRNLSISNIFTTANNRELGSQFHSLLSNSHEVCLIHV